MARFWKALDLLFAIVTRRKRWVLEVQCNFCGHKATIDHPNGGWVRIARKRNLPCPRCLVGRIALLDLCEVDEATEAVRNMMFCFATQEPPNDQP